jgi:RNA polymerase sigma factor (sigma-70 family)
MTGTQAGVILRQIHKLAGPPDTPDGELLERFTAAREGPAFEALVRRHGPMVLGVCRRVLGNLHDAEDAFQATFLTLASKAGSICKQQSVGSWLYGVAFRVAAKARGKAATRRRYEGRAHAAPAADPLAELTGRELLSVLDEELQGLPERYRAPLVLCYLQGLTCDEAARRAGHPVRTFKRRLEQGRERLRGRLARRGLTLPAALMATGLAQAAEAAVPARLAGAAVRAALRGTNPEAAPPAVGPAAASSLAGGAAGLLGAVRLKVVAAVLVVGGLVALGAGALAQQAPVPSATPAGAGPKQPGLAPGAGNKPAAPAKKEKGVSVSGRVLGADEKPLAGAEVALVGGSRFSKDRPNHDYEVLARGKTDAEGRFRLARKDLSPTTFYQFHALAGARGHGLGWLKLPGPGKAENVELRLEAERVVRGRLFDLQGLPAKGVKGRLVYLSWKEPRKGGWGLLDQRVERERMMAEMQMRRARGQGVVPYRRPDGIGFDLPRAPEGLPFWPRAFTTDGQGRFEVRRLSAGQEAHLLIEDDRFALQELLLDSGDKKAPPEATLSLAPPQRIEGRVVYEDTGKPVAGAHLNFSAFRQFVGKDAGARTDAQGRFSINPYPGTSYQIRAWAPADKPYLNVEKRLEWPKGAARRTVDIALPRGVEVRGKVLEKPSGAAVGQVRIVYAPQQGNEVARKHQLLVGSYWPARSEADGSYRIVVPPGPGRLLVDADSSDFIVRKTSQGEVATGKPGGAPRFHHEIVALDPKLGDSPLARDLELRRGVTLRGTALGPDGKRVSRGMLICPGELVPPDAGGMLLFASGGPPPRGVVLEKGVFELRGCDPERTYRVFAVDAAGALGGVGAFDGMGKMMVARQLVGEFQARAGAVVELSAAKAKGGELTVQLQPCGSAQIRLRDAAGKPSRATPWVELEVVPDRGKLEGERAALAPRGFIGLGKTPMTPDKEGRLTVRGLVPGATYRLKAYDFRAQAVVALGEAFTVEAGKTRKLPDVVAPQASATP